MAQSTALQGSPHIIVATPGRLAAHVSQGSAGSLRHVAFLVFDEADRLLEMGFANDLETIVEALPSTKRQTLLYSATMTQSLERLRSIAARGTRRTFEFHETETERKPRTCARESASLRVPGTAPWRKTAATRPFRSPEDTQSKRFTAELVLKHRAPHLERATGRPHERSMALKLKLVSVHLHTLQHSHTVSDRPPRTSYYYECCSPAAATKSQ